MSEMKETRKTVEAFVEELRKNPSNRFSKGDFQMLVYYILSDEDFKAKKHLFRSIDVIEEDVDISGAMRKFMNRLLKHAGVNKDDEREAIIKSFTSQMRIQDIEWIVDAVDEAMWIYTECGKNMRMFRNKMLQLTIQKMVRTGRYDGKITYKKKVVDRMLDMQKRRNGDV